MKEYILLCLISILTGKGLLKLFKLHIPFSSSIYLSPIITFAFWALFVGLGTSLHFPGKDLWQTGYLLTCIFSILGLFTFSKEAFNKKFLCILLSTVSLPIIVMLPYFSLGLFNYGSANAWDGWSYIAYGQYLWQNSRGAEGNLIPLYQYAAHLAHTRFIASALLNFFSPFAGTPGDTQLTSHLLCAWALFNLASASAFFITSEKHIKWIPGYLVLVLFNGWILNVLDFNNFDNALVLCLLPTFAGIANYIQQDKIKWAIILACLTAACLFTYIELSPAILFCMSVFFIQPLFFSEKTDTKKNMIFIGTLLLLTLLLFSPAIKESINFFYNQLASLKPGVIRSGEGAFPIINSHPFIAIWGFKYHHIGSALMSIILYLLVSLGLMKLWAKKNYGLIAACLLLFLGYLDMAFRQHYPYGAYKFILLDGWLLFFCVFVAVNKIIADHTRWKTSLLIILTITSIFFLIINFNLQQIQAKSYAVKDIRPYRALSDIKSIVGNKAIQVTVNDMYANEWAVYYLRNYPIKLILYRCSMAQNHVIPFMRRAKKINPKDISFLLTSESTTLPKKFLVWSSGPYYLWRLSRN